MKYTGIFELLIFIVLYLFFAFIYIGFGLVTRIVNMGDILQVLLASLPVWSSFFLSGALMNRRLADSKGVHLNLKDNFLIFLKTTLVLIPSTIYMLLLWFIVSVWLSTVPGALSIEGNNFQDYLLLTWYIGLPFYSLIILFYSIWHQFENKKVAAIKNKVIL